MLLNLSILSQPERVAGGAMITSVQPYTYAIEQAVRSFLMREGFLAQADLPLAAMHTYLSERSRRLPQGAEEGANESPINTALERCVASDPAFRSAYYALVSSLARHVLGRDAVFQREPTLRFVFPERILEHFRSSDGCLLSYHTDILFGDPPEQINFWLPLTSCFGGNALQLAGLPESQEILKLFLARSAAGMPPEVNARQFFFLLLRDDAEFRDLVTSACRPVVMEPGSILAFDARSIHGTGDNDTKATRLSLDFRLVPLLDYESMLDRNESQSFLGNRMIRGEYYNQNTAYEVSVEI